MEGRERVEKKKRVKRDCTIVPMMILNRCQRREGKKEGERK